MLCGRSVTWLPGLCRDLMPEGRSPAGQGRGRGSGGRGRGAGRRDGLTKQPAKAAGGAVSPLGPGKAQVRVLLPGWLSLILPPLPILP